MPTLDLRDLDGGSEEEKIEVEISTERFDRIAFAQRALDLLRPPRTRVVLCEGIHRLRVQAGRRWGEPEAERWALVSVPPTASKRAIALAMTELAGRPGAPYVMDVLLADAPAT